MATLTVGQKEQFVERGYVSGLEVFGTTEMDGLRTGYRELCRLLEPGEGPGAVREWHMASRWLYDVCSAPALLEIVEGLLGPSFYLWGSQFFAKSPHSSSTVAWHQDGYYWPLAPLHESVTAWLAFEDVDEGNGAMQVIPGSHRAGLLQHRKHVSESVLTLELEDGTFSADDAVSLNLVAGQTSFHHDSIVHGSPANASDRDRVGLTVRYSASQRALRPRPGAAVPGLSAAGRGQWGQPGGGDPRHTIRPSQLGNAHPEPRRGWRRLRVASLSQPGPPPRRLSRARYTTSTASQRSVTEEPDTGAHEDYVVFGACGDNVISTCRPSGMGNKSHTMSSGLVDVVAERDGTVRRNNDICKLPEPACRGPAW